MESLYQSEYVALLLALMKKDREKRNGTKLPSDTLSGIKSAIKRTGEKAGYGKQRIRKDIRVALLQP